MLWFLVTNGDESIVLIDGRLLGSFTNMEAINSSASGGINEEYLISPLLMLLAISLYSLPLNGA